MVNLAEVKAGSTVKPRSGESLEVETSVLVYEPNIGFNIVKMNEQDLEHIAHYNHYTTEGFWMAVELNEVAAITIDGNQLAETLPY